MSNKVSSIQEQFELWCLDSEYSESNFLLPSTFEVRAGGSCVLAARIIVGKLLAQGVTGITVIEGFFQCIAEDDATPKDMRFEHTWVETDDEIYDPTISQFSEYIDYYKYFLDDKSADVKKYSAQEYLDLEFLNTETPEQFFSDDIVPDDIKQYLPSHMHLKRST